MFYIKGDCPICRTGIPGIRRCTDGYSLVVMCDECETVWASPELISISESLDADPPNFEIPKLGIALVIGSRGWATSQEIMTKGWAQYLAGEHHIEQA